MSETTRNLIAAVQAERDAEDFGRRNRYGAMVRALALGGRSPTPAEARAIMSEAGIAADQLERDVAKARDYAARLEAIRELPRRMRATALAGAEMRAATAKLAAATSRLQAEKQTAVGEWQSARTSEEFARTDLIELLGGHAAMKRTPLGRLIQERLNALNEIHAAIARARAVEAAGPDALGVGNDYTRIEPSDAIPPEGVAELERQEEAASAALLEAIALVERLEHVDWSTGEVRVEAALSRGTFAVPSGPGLHS